LSDAIPPDSSFDAASFPATPAPPVFLAGFIEARVFAAFLDSARFVVPWAMEQGIGRQDFKQLAPEPLLTQDTRGDNFPIH
jgi:hypothetical protein